MRRSRSISSCAAAVHYQHERSRYLACRPATCACSGVGCRIRWTTLRRCRSMPARICRWCISSACICPSDVPHRLMTGATLVTRATDAADDAQFRALEPLCALGRSGQDRSTPSNELLLRLERVRFEPYRLVPTPARTTACRQSVRPAVVAQCRAHVRLHRRKFPLRHRLRRHRRGRRTSIPKYAMSVFKKSTGMTLNEYVNLLQAELRAGAADE